MNERRGTDKITKLHKALIIGSFILLAINLLLSWTMDILLALGISCGTIKISWMLHVLVLGLMTSANLYKVPSFLKWIDRMNGGKKE